jgi:hypothetical protein
VQTNPQTNRTAALGDRPVVQPDDGKWSIGSPNPQTNRTACQGRPVRKEIISTHDHTENAPNLQAFRLVSKFGFAFETAVVVAALAWGLAR